MPRCWPRCSRALHAGFVRRLFRSRGIIRTAGLKADRYTAERGASRQATQLPHSQWPPLSAGGMEKSIAGFRTRPTVWLPWWAPPGSHSHPTSCRMYSWELRLDIRSAASLCFGNDRAAPGLRRLGLLLASVISVCGAGSAQLTTGIIEGTLRDSDGRFLAGESIVLTGPTGFHMLLLTASRGDFYLTLPYGRYQLSGVDVTVTAAETRHVDLVRDRSGAIRMLESRSRIAGNWIDHTKARQYPEAFSLQSLLLNREPSTVTQPLDFSGLSDNRLA